MSYTITKSDGTVLTTIVDGTLDTTTSIDLPGPNYVGYGQYLNENLVYLLENFASNVAPGGQNLQGQLWFDKSDQTLKVFTSQGYLNVAGTVVSETQPVIFKTGDIWYNTTTNQLFMYDGTQYQLVAPVYTRAQGVSGAIPVQLSDALVTGLTHNVLQLQYGNVILATISSDTAFQPTPSIPGFTTINPGITFSTSVLAPTINANIVGGVTGNVVGSLTGAAVVASNLYGTLTGNVVGNVTAGTVNSNNISGSAIYGNFYGNASSALGYFTNFSSGNAQITGGSATGLISTSAVTAQATNFSSSNIQVTGGSAIGLTTLVAAGATFNTTQINGQLTATGGGTVTGLSVLTSANIATTTAQATNFSSANAQITGGNVTGGVVHSATTGTFTTLNSTTHYTTNLSSPNVQVSGGSLSGITNLNATTATAANFASGNAQITGGSSTGLTTVTTTNLAGTTTVATNFSSGNAQITGGIVTNLTNLTSAAAGLTNITSSGTVTFTNQSTATLVATNFSSGNARIAGGLIDGATIGSVTPPAATFTTVTATSATTSGTTTAGTFAMGSWTLVPSGTKLLFKYNGTTVASLDSSGNFISAANMSAYTTP